MARRQRMKARSKYRSKSNVRPYDIKILVCITLFFCFSIVKCSNLQVFSNIRQELHSVFDTKHIASVVEVIGKSFNEGDVTAVFKSDAVKSFTDKIIPQDTDKKDDTNDTETTDKGSEDELLSFFIDTVSEQPPPKEILQPQIVDNAEEYIDNTENKAFEIPAPDKVDETNYKMAFSHKNPVKGYITSEFGYREHPIDGNTKFHYGLDLGAKTGTAIYAFADGVVTEVKETPVYGKNFMIKHSNGFTSFYAHCNAIYVKEGDKVKIGQKVASVGATGNVTGPHLHFEVRKNGKILNPNFYVDY